MDSIWAARLAQLKREIPEVFDGQGKTCLYVGIMPHRSQGYAELRAAGYDVTILEAFKRFADHYGAVHGDVRKVADLFPGKRWDLVFWWHGPEHIQRGELTGTLAMLEERSDMVVLGCPWGKNVHPVVDGNPFSTHPSTIYESDLRALGYDTRTLGTIDRPSTWCHILAWKKTR